MGPPLRKMHFFHVSLLVTWYFSVYIWQQISSGGFSEIWGRLPLWGCCYSPSKFIGQKKQNGHHSLYGSSDKNFHEIKKISLWLICKKDLGQKFKSEKLW